MAYSEKLKSPFWQRKRLEIMQRDDFKCRFCGRDDKQLHIHHVIYLPNKEPWEYDDNYLVTVCNSCHYQEEKIKEFDSTLMGNFILSGLSRRDLYCLATELRRHLSDSKTRSLKFQNLMDYLYEQED